MSTRAYTFVSIFLFAAPLSAQPIPFDICAESTTWVRPAPEVQAKIWNMGRYNGFAHDGYGTHNFLAVDDPLSASVAYDVRNESGLWTAGSESFDKCNSGENPRRSGDQWIAAWVLLHRVTQVTHQDNTYSVTVEPTGKGFQFVYIRRMNPKAVLRFVTPDGMELERWDESAPPNRVKNEVPPGTRIIGPNGEIIRK